MGRNGRLTTTDMKLSGNSYVPMRLREDDTTVKPSPTRIMLPVNCEHQHTICTVCAWTWEIDWVVFYERTAGGRKLADTKAPAGTDF